ncbi:MAG: toprim domain-containing protein [Dactylosporangium sp.]|nr:toprim domain-containing protein [Dactylosporangium sp.]NNJ62244.1 toprim domain-containing protein [Dactylosporangium sp.]
MSAFPAPQRIIAAHQLAADFYRSHLLAEPRALAYLRSRGIDGAAAHAAPWTIGYAPYGWTTLRDHLHQNGFTDQELLAAGLATTARNGQIIDVFRDRVVFPIRNADRRVVAFTGRDLSGRENTPKYRNTATTAVYQKKRFLYGLAEQFGGDRQPPAVMLVEGPADVLAVARLYRGLSEAVYPERFHAVAPCGTALTTEQVELLAEAVAPGTPIVIAFDADTAGYAAADKSHQLLREWAGNVDAIALPPGWDPAALVAEGPTDAALGFADLRTPLVDLILHHRLSPHRERLSTRLDELHHLGRDVSIESLQIRLNTLRALTPLVAGIADDDPAAAARLAHTLTVELDLNPLAVFEAIYPPTDDTTIVDRERPGADAAVPVIATTAAETDHDPAPSDPTGGPVVLGCPGYPDPDLVGHQYARTRPTADAAATWVEHDPATGHSAWVVAEGITATDADRHAARLAAEVAGRVAVLVGAEQAIGIARNAVNAQNAQSGTTGQGNASITVLTSFDENQPSPGRDRFTVAWAGDTRAYAATSRWFAQLTVDHTLRGRSTAMIRDDLQRQQAARQAAKHHRPAPDDAATLARAVDPHWLRLADLPQLAAAWRTALVRHDLSDARAAAEAVEQRLRQAAPDLVRRYRQVIATGAQPAHALWIAAPVLVAVPTRVGDTALTASVRSGRIDVNRIDLPVTQILLAGRALAAVASDQLRAAVDGRRPAVAVEAVQRLGGASTAALVVRPRSGRIRCDITAASLARQDQPTASDSAPAPRILPDRPHLAALPAVASTGARFGR